MIRICFVLWKLCVVFTAAVLLQCCSDPETDGIDSSQLVGSWSLSGAAEQHGIALGGATNARLSINRNGSFSVSSLPIQFLRPEDISPKSFDGSGRWSFETRTGPLRELVLRFAQSSAGDGIEISWEASFALFDCDYRLPFRTKR
jgi:hypothetical protein